MMIYNRSLSAEEVKTNYQMNLAKFNDTLWIFTSYLNNLNSYNYSYNASASDNLGYANTTESRWFFINMDPILTLILSKPPTGCSENWGCYTPGCSECEYPFFNNSLYINYNVTPFGQNETRPFWIVNNTGSVAANITVQLNQTSYPGVKFKIITAFGDNEHVCSNSTEPSGGCMYVVDTSIHTVVSNLGIGEIANLWLFTDFVGVPGGTSVNRNITVNSTLFAN